MSADLIQSISTAWEKFIEHEERSTPSNRPYCYASGFEACDRKLVLQMTRGDKVLPFPTETKAKFRRGKDRERNTILDMQMIGRFSEPPFEVISQQKPFQLKDHKGRIAISGKVDLILDFGRGNQQVPCELKDFFPAITDRIFTFDDVLRGKWTHKAARQTLCYLFGEGVELGLLVFTRPGLPKLIPVYLSEHLDLVEEFLSKAESALDHKEAGTIPDFIQDAEECKRCYFYGSICNPPIMSGEGAQIITDPEVIEDIRRHDELERAASEYEALDKMLKDKFRGYENAIAGDFLLQGKWQKNTTYPVSEEVKLKIKELQRPFLKDDPKGKFFMKITNLASKEKEEF
jgi:hypothetical protein